MKRPILIAVTLTLLAVAGWLAADVTLTTPEAIRSEIGGGGTVDFDRIRTLSVRVHPDQNLIDAEVELYASADASQPAHRGTFRVEADEGRATLQIETLGFRSGVTLNPGQAQSARNLIANHVKQVEQLMVQYKLARGNAN